MKEILTSTGFIALVDNDDYEYISQWSWSTRNIGNGKYRYVCRSETRNKKRTSIFLHRQILGFPKADIDHINHNTLDNRRENLRISSHQHNCFNRGINKNNKSGFKGVYIRRPGLWVAQIRHNYKARAIGYFNNPIDAALAYDRAALEVFGDYAMTNKALGLL